MFAFWFRAFHFLVFLFLVPALPTFLVFLTYPSVFVVLASVPKSLQCKVVVRAQFYLWLPIASVFRITFCATRSHD